MKILFLIRSLNYGGAERQLAILAGGLLQRRHEVVVVTFYPGGQLENDLRNAGVRLLTLNKGGRWDLLGFFWRLLRVVRDERPDVLHGYLYDPNLFVVLLKAFQSGVKCVWGIRVAWMDMTKCDWVAKLSFRLSAWLSSWADAIVVNSYTGGEYHVGKGYPARKTVVIPNGIDTGRFRPDPRGRARLREEWGVRSEHRLVGVVGRLDPIKDHPIFLHAAALLVQRRPNVRFVCVGEGPAEYRDELKALSDRLGLDGLVQWAGGRDDMVAVYNALDINVNCSYGEGLSNVIAEAMACEVPCVVTDVGDSAMIVGNQGLLVPPKDPVALMTALERLIETPPTSVVEIRRRIVERLSVESLVLRTERVLEAVVRRDPGGVSSLSLAESM